MLVAAKLSEDERDNLIQRHMVMTQSLTQKVSLLPPCLLYIGNIWHQFFFFLVPLQVSIVFSLFRLCSAAEKPVLPYYTKAAVISAVRTVVDGFLEMWVFSQYRLISVSAYGWASQSCQFYLCAELLHFQNCSMHKKSISSLSRPRSDLHSFTIAFKGLVGLVVLMSSHLPFHSVYFFFGRTCGYRDQLSQEEGVVDKMQVFRPDRVFMVQKKKLSLITWSHFRLRPKNLSTKPQTLNPFPPLAEFQAQSIILFLAIIDCILSKHYLSQCGFSWFFDSCYFRFIMRFMEHAIHDTGAICWQALLQSSLSLTSVQL